MILSDLRVLVIAQDTLTRMGLAALLGGQPGCAVAGQLTGDEDLASSIDVFHPDVVVWDLGWDPAGGLEYLAGAPDTLPPVLALVAGEAHAGQAWSAGARGVLLREGDGDRLLSALSAVAQGLAVFDPALPTTMPNAGGPAPETDLTRREIETLNLLAEGLPNKAIASRLGISEHTVKFHVNSILGKLGAQSRTEAVTRATRLGLILL